MKKEQLAFVIANKFLTPDDPKIPYEEMLKEAVELSKDSDFIKKRGALHEWQENILRNDMTTKQAVNEMEIRLEEYNNIIKKSHKNVISKVAFLILEFSLGLAGTHLGDPLATTTGMVSLAKFWKFDRKPELDSGDPAMVASMIFDAQHSLNW